MTESRVSVPKKIVKLDMNIKCVSLDLFVMFKIGNHGGLHVSS